MITTSQDPQPTSSWKQVRRGTCLDHDLLSLLLTSSPPSVMFFNSCSTASLNKREIKIENWVHPCPTSIVTPSLGGSTVSWISLITFEGKIEWTRKIILPPPPRACSGIRQGWVSSWRQRTRAWWRPQCAPGSSNGGATFPQTARIMFQIWWSCSNQNRQ